MTHNRLKRSASRTHTFSATDKTHEVVPWKSAKTGQFLKKATFQLFSAGKDGLYNTPDDIGNW